MTHPAPNAFRVPAGPGAPSTLVARQRSRIGTAVRCLCGPVDAGVVHRPRRMDGANACNTPRMTGVRTATAKSRRWTPLLSVSWKIRWIVFAVAIIDNALASRWNALIAVTIIAILSGTTPAFRARWRTTLRGLGDERATADGFGPTLAAMIRTGRRVPDLERAAALTPSANRPRPAGTTIGRSGKTR